MAEATTEEVKQPEIEKGNISVHTENIFPIIKRSLYSDHEIFLRELISNAVDATQKMKHLASIGKFKDELGELKIVVEVDKENKTITVRDRGIGMSQDEVRKYINQVAFSGAEEFVKKFKGVKDSKEIIGQFGLGFYSAFMVADNVEIFTRSYKKNQGGAHWTCDGSTSYTLEKYSRKERGTDIILHIAEDSEEFLESSRIQNILDKYCKFLPVEIEFEEKIVNNTDPIWNKTPSSLTDEDYLKFFKELYPFAEDPLFWIHLNVDYPFELTGILYFPKLKNELEMRKDRIHLYSRQVFITDSVQDIVPEYLTLLQGVIDSPDIPLNVSRSYLQADSNVRKISTYITKKVADKLKELYKEDKEKYTEKWPDIEVFVKFGMLSDDKFYDKAVDFALLKNVDGEHFDLEDYKAKITEHQTDKDGNLVYIYANQPEAQQTYIQSAKKRNFDVLELSTLIDSHFVGLLERKFEKTQWKRVDSDAADKLVEKDQANISLFSEEEENDLKEVYKGIVPEESMVVQAEALGQEEMPVMITRPEFMRRMKEMSMTGGGGMGMGNLPDSVNIVVNTSHDLNEKVMKQEGDEARQGLAKQLLDLALLSQGMLTGTAMTAFIDRSLGFINQEKA